MARYFLEIAYKGTDFCGWQQQIEVRTVQAELTTRIQILLPDVPFVVGCGRTDTGVHASQYFLHFDTQHILPESFVFKLNKMLPPDVAVYRCIPVNDDAHARYSATLREYKYYIRSVKNPFSWRLSNWVHQPLDVQQMAQAAVLLLNYRNFAAFERTGSNTTNSLCTIHRVSLEMEKDQLVFTIAANRFLRNMVRAITGTLINVGKGKTSLEDFDEIIRSQDRSRAGKSALADGLHLTRVEYPFIQPTP